MTSPASFTPGTGAASAGRSIPGESAHDALRRELAEELEFVAAHCDDFIRLDFDLASVNRKKIYRIYYEVHVTASEASQFVQHEGADAKVLQATDMQAGRSLRRIRAVASPCSARIR